MKYFHVLLGLFFSFLTAASAQTTDILTGLTKPRGIAINGDELYFTELTANRILKIDLTQTNPSPVEVVTGLDTPKELVFNGNTLYVSEANRISRVDVTSSLPATRQDFFVGIEQPQGMLIHNNYLYTKGANNNVFKFNLDNPTIDVSLVFGANLIYDFVKIGNDAYVTQENAIRKFDLTANTPSLGNVINSSQEPLLAGINVGMTAINNTIYFLQNPTGRLLSFNINDPVGTFGQLLNISAVGDVTSYKGDLYISDFDNGKIIKYELPDTTPTTDIAHYYSLDSQTVVDEIGNEDPTVVLSTVVSSGAINRSHAFDNADNITLFNFAPTSFTINFWFKTNDINKTQRIFHRGGYGGSAYDRYSYSLVYIPNQGFRLGLGSDAGSNAALIYANTSADLTDWHMITCTYDLSTQTARIYIDGNLEASDTSLQGIYANPNYQLFLEFSRYPLPGSPQAIDGNLDEIGLWTRAISDTEVTTLYNETATLSIDDFDLTGARVELFPNPAKNFIKVSNLNTSGQFKIYNLLGQPVKQGSIDNNQTIDISNLIKGLYLLKFKNDAKTLRFAKE
ncbi:LamG-like jellyroll fold domain-containing protein [Aquimarina agarilytica]|uniref:LamG-like jellyroll fold domain-containing protein n=1 Tax=Aquimarina agarilytica TaxID=1087449 RepID=UPI0002881626|nr:LamG-like jellyroll fold domain-containing protein [Aquimarina agarilytica]